MNSEISPQCKYGCIFPNFLGQDKTHCDKPLNGKDHLMQVTQVRCEVCIKMNMGYEPKENK